MLWKINDGLWKKNDDCLQGTRLLINKTRRKASKQGEKGRFKRPMFQVDETEILYQVDDKNY